MDPELPEGPENPPPVPGGSPLSADGMTGSCCELCHGETPVACSWRGKMEQRRMQILMMMRKM